MKKGFAILLAAILCLCLCLAGCACEHEFGEWTVKEAATCAKEGTEHRFCTKCNEEQESVLPKAEHNFGVWEVTKAATCTDVGTETRTCSGCGTKEDKELSAVDHTYGGWEVTKAATCTNVGTETKTCTGCGATEEREIQVIAHSFGDWEVTKAATCTENGTQTKTCQMCGSKEEDSIPAEHQWKAATCTKPQTCSECGKTSGSAKGHEWKDATCSTAKTCSICSTTEGQPLEHAQGSDGKCIYCGKSLVQIGDVLSVPFDTIEDVQAVAGHYYAKDCYKVGNFRFIFNSADGVILSWGARNTSDKEIKYLTFTVAYYNRVGDPAYDEITGKSSCTTRLTGPIGAGKGFYIRSLIGYGSDIYYGVITDVKIEYMDGTTLTGYYGYTTWHNIRSTGSPKECVVIED